MNNPSIPPANGPVQSPPRKVIAPQVDIVETSESYILVAEIPGVPRGGVNVSVTDNTLTIDARRLASTEAGARTLHRESVPADFHRSFELSPSVDTSSIRAEIDQGLLRLTLPKVSQVKPQNIRVE